MHNVPAANQTGQLPSRSEVTPATLAERYYRAISAGSPPALAEFLAATPDAAPAEVGAVLRVELRERRRRGERVLAEALLAQFPQVACDRTAAIDLIYTEYLLGEELGEPSSPDDYARRFPDYAEELSDQIEMHFQLNATGLSTDGAMLEGDDDTISRDMTNITPGAPWTIGRYEVLRLLGGGGMGVVYLARDQLLDREVAVKLPRLADNFSAEQIDRFYREARVVARLSNPHLCAIHDVGQQDGVPYLAMQYVEGETLEARLRREGPLEPLVALEIADQIAAALEVVHRSGVLHRDLKPANVMMTSSGDVVVMDFGVAHLTLSEPSEAADLQALCDTTPLAASHGSRLTMTGQLLGTPAYAAPEQLAGAAPLTPACDIYSLGGVLYEILTGRAPFVGTLPELRLQVSSAEAPPPSSLRAEVPRVLDTLCMTALAKAPSARFASMTDLRAALDAGRAAILESAAPAVATRASWRQRRLRRVATAAVALVAIVAAGWQSIRPAAEPAVVEPRVESATLATPPESEIPVLPIVVDPNAPELKLVRKHPWRDRHAFSTQFSPDGKYYTAGGEFHRNEKIRIWETATGDQVTEIGANVIRFSPSSGEVVYPSKDLIGRIDVKRLDGQDALPFVHSTVQLPTDLISDLVFSSDGQTMLSLHDNSHHRYGARLWDFESRLPKADLVFEDCETCYVSLLSDGKTALAYDVLGFGRVAHSIDLSSGELGQTIIDPDASDFRLLRAASEGMRYAIFNRRAITFWQFPNPTPQRRLELPLANAGINAKAISNDLRWALCTSEDTFDVNLINLTTGKSHGVSHALDHAAIGHHAFSPDGRYAVICSSRPSTVYLLEMPPEVWQTGAAE